MLIEGLRLWVAGTNAWLVAPSGPGGECVLIDAPPDPAAILGRLRDQRLKLVAVLATHGHVDHVGGIAEVVGAQPSPTPVRIHDDDRHMLLDPIGVSGTLGEPPILFSGDHLFKGSIGRTDLPGGSREQLLESMAAKILPLPDDVQVLPGHGDTTTVGQERVTNPFLLGLVAKR